MGVLKTPHLVLGRNRSAKWQITSLEVQIRAGLRPDLDWELPVINIHEQHVRDLEQAS